MKYDSTYSVAYAILKKLKSNIPVPPEPREKYLIFKALQANSSVTYTKNVVTSAEYSIDGGSNWLDADEVTVALNNIGDEVYYKGIIDGAQYDEGEPFAHFTCEGGVKVYGNINSLNNGRDVFEYTDMYQRLFDAGDNNPGLIDASELKLPTLILTNYCYFGMFYNCQNLVSAPELPATTLAEYCYRDMFTGCTSLTTAPELPATTLVNNCYERMFLGCSSLINTPELFNTTLANGCYSEMFSDCISLTTAPILPATTLTEYCYSAMFYGCTNLTTAPILPATEMKYWCYGNMFAGCSKLNYVKHNIVSWNENDSATWLANTAETGVVECPINSTIISNSTSGIPTGWTRVDF